MFQGTYAQFICFFLRKGWAAGALSLWEQRGLRAAKKIRFPLPFVIPHLFSICEVGTGSREWWPPLAGEVSHDGTHRSWSRREGKEAAELVSTHWEICMWKASCKLQTHPGVAQGHRDKLVSGWAAAMWCQAFTLWWGAVPGRKLVLKSTVG